MENMKTDCSELILLNQTNKKTFKGILCIKMSENDQRYIYIYFSHCIQGNAAFPLVACSVISEPPEAAIISGVCMRE